MDLKKMQDAITDSIESLKELDQHGLDAAGHQILLAAVFNLMMVAAEINTAIGQDQKEF